MTAITSELVQKLREKTGAGIMDCKRALEDSGSDLDKAIQILREKGIASASKRNARSAKEGLIASYIHGGGKLGVLLEVDCESDFVARTEDFAQFTKEISMQIAAVNPQWVSREDVPGEVIEKEKGILREQTLNEGKPEKIVDKIVEGRLNKYYEQFCLLDQAYIRDTSGKTKVKNLLDEVKSKLGENIIIRRFARFKVGEE